MARRGDRPGGAALRGTARLLIAPLLPAGSLLRLWVVGSYAAACLIGLAALGVTSFRFTVTDELSEQADGESSGAPPV